MARQYNYIFNKVVGDENDIVGQIAYSLYKRSKMEFILQFKEDNPNVEDLTEDDFKRFNQFSSTEQQVNNLRIQANLILQDFLDASMEESILEVEKLAEKDIESRLSAVIDKIKPLNRLAIVLEGFIDQYLWCICFRPPLCSFRFHQEGKPSLLSP